MNLLEETIKVIEKIDKSTDKIVFIGSKDGSHSCTWEEFEHLADIEYHNGYGGQEIASDLVIVFDDGSSMRRHEYDGSERWLYESSLVPAINPKAIITLSNGEPWSTIEAMQKPDGERYEI